MNSIKIRYSTNVKEWFRNMDNHVINYLHCSESNDMYLVHMSLPKSRIDRTCCYSKVYRW